MLEGLDGDIISTPNKPIPLEVEDSASTDLVVHEG